MRRALSYSKDLSASSSAFVEELAFHDRFEVLRERYVDLWLRAADVTPDPWEPLSRATQKDHERATEQLIEKLARELRTRPEEEAPRRVWRNTLRQRVGGFAKSALGWSPVACRELLSDPMLRLSEAFIRQARAFAPWLTVDDLFQALRNVWIMNALQLLFARPLELTPAIFAYSMLYPLTDNPLDDPSLSGASKKALGCALGRALAGEDVTPRDPLQADVIGLVARIEQQYPRAAFPDVFASLEAIHRAQMASLRQGSCRARLSDRELLGISIAKGGASVLADGYLVVGTLAEKDADFCFGYGVFLQLLDDLQDAEEDHRAGRDTLFSRRLGEAPLDAVTCRLYGFMMAVLDSAPRLNESRHAVLKDMIRRNCVHLMIAAVGAQKPHFTSSFAAAMERYSALGFAASKRLRRTTEKRFSKVRRALTWRQNRIDEAFQAFWPDASLSEDQ